MKNREVYLKVEIFLSLMAFLLIEQTVGGNVASEEDPYIEGGKTIIVKWMWVSVSEKIKYEALTAIILQSKYFHGRKRVNILIALFPSAVWTNHPQDATYNIHLMKLSYIKRELSPYM